MPDSTKQAAEFNKEATEFRKSAADAQVQVEKLNAANNGLGQILLPRQAISWEETPELSALNQFAGVNVMVISVPDLEAMKFASQIGGLLSQPSVSWNTQTKFESLPAALNTPPGVLIMAPMNFDPRTHEPDFSTQEQRAARAFMEYLSYSTTPMHLPDIKATISGYPPRPRWWPAEFIPPPTTILIFVGLKPIEDEISDIRWANELPEKFRRKISEQKGLLPLSAPTR